MHFLKFGSRKKFIVFLHGWASDLNSFLWLKDCFVDEYSLLFLDFDGFGKSPEPNEVMSVSDYVLKLKSLLDEFCIDELVFVAHSFGGRVAIKFLFYFQSAYKKTSLCLIDSAGIKPRRNLIYYFKVLRYRNLKNKKNKTQKDYEKLAKFGSDDYKVLSNIMKQTFVNVVNENLSNCAKFLKSKTIIVWGEKDRETKPFMARKLNKLIKDSKLVFLKDAGHFSFIEKKEEFIIIGTQLNQLLFHQKQKQLKRVLLKTALL